MKKQHNTSLFSFIGRTMRCIMIILESRFKEEGIPLNLAQFILLNILSNHDDLILEDLSKYLNKDKSATLRHINHLENEHLIAKMIDKNDRRRKILIPTKKGMKLLQTAREVEENLVQDLTVDQSDRAIGQFKKVLGEMKEQASIILEKN